MRGKRTERIVRILSRLLLAPSSPISLTEIAAEFNVSKTLVSDDVEILAEAIELDGSGRIVTDRGRIGGASFIPSPSDELRRRRLSALAEQMSTSDRLLPGGLLYYADILQDPAQTSFLGCVIASMHEQERPTAVMTTEDGGISLGLFCARALGVPLAACRGTSSPTDGPVVGVHYPAGDGLKTMYVGTRSLGASSRVLIVDDFLRTGSRMSGMELLAHELGALVIGEHVFIAMEGAHDKDKKRSPTERRSLFSLSIGDDGPTVKVS